MKTPEEMAEEWARSETAQTLANYYEVAAANFLGQQKAFQAHIDGQNTGFKNGFLAGYAAAQPKWISVKERLPEIPDGHFISKEVLWISCYGEMEVSFLEKLRSELRIDWGEAGLYKLDQVTHWMLLPEPPKESE